MKDKEVISSFDRLSAKLPKELDLSKNNSRVDALRHYFSKGGIVSVVSNGGDWPKLLYPNKARLKQQILEAQELRKAYAEKLGVWKQKFEQAKVYHLMNNVKKLKEPLFWKHTMKYLADSDYRKDADSVKLPAHLVSDKRWKPMVQMFVDDLDYRKQLAETVDKSIVYKDNKTVARFADDLRLFRMQQSGRQIEELEKKISVLDQDIDTLQELIKWASF